MISEEAIKILKANYNNYSETLKEVVNKAIETVEKDMAIKALEQPEIEEDVVPIVHAKWKNGRCTNCLTDKPVVMASVVQGYMHQYQGRLNYCPNCGAEMECER